MPKLKKKGVNCSNYIYLWGLREPPLAWISWTAPFGLTKAKSLSPTILMLFSRFNLDSARSHNFKLVNLECYEVTN